MISARHSTGDFAGNWVHDSAPAKIVLRRFDVSHGPASAIKKGL